MEQYKFADLCSALQSLSNIKRPSKRVKKAVNRLEDRICFCIETMQTWTTTVQVPKR
jgi:hypothetical protein